MAFCSSIPGRTLVPSSAQSRLELTEVERPSLERWSGRARNSPATAAARPLGDGLRIACIASVQAPAGTRGSRARVGGFRDDAGARYLLKRLRSAPVPGPGAEEIRQARRSASSAGTTPQCPVFSD